jgi:HEAT repeat protein
MKRKRSSLHVAVVVGVLSVAIGCSDVNDPDHWVGKMYDRPWREQALKNLNELFNRTMRDNGDELSNPNVKKFVDHILPQLLKAYDDFSRDRLNRLEIIKILAKMKDARAIRVFMDGLNFEPTDESETFEVCAGALSEQSVEEAIPKLLNTHDQINASRASRPGAPFSSTENEIELAVVTAASSILEDKPSSSYKERIVKILCNIAETSDELQDLRLNMKAMQGLGRIGEKAAIPSLVKGIAMKGKVQPIALGPIAVSALQQVRDRDAVAEAVIAFSKGTDASFNEFYKEELQSDPLMKNPLWSLQEGMNFLGTLNYGSPKVIGFLESELNHMEPDAADEKTAGVKDLELEYTAKDWAGMRRNWAAIALSRIAYKPVLDVIKSRMVFKKKKLDLPMEEAMGYVQALGYLQYPKESCGLLLNVAENGEDNLRDKAYYNASLMCGGEFVKMLKKDIAKVDCNKIIKEKYPDGLEEDEEREVRKECDVMTRRIQGYIDRIEYGGKCNDIACHGETLDDKSGANVERAIYSLYRIGRDEAGKTEQVVDVLAQKIDNPSMDAMQAFVFAVDHLTPKGGAKILKRVEEVAKRFSGQSTYKDRARLLDALAGHLRARSQ